MLLFVSSVLCSFSLILFFVVVHCRVLFNYFHYWLITCLFCYSVLVIANLQYTVYLQITFYHFTYTVRPLQCILPIPHSFFKPFFKVEREKHPLYLPFPTVSSLCGFKFPPVTFSAGKTYFSCSTGLPTMDYLTFCLCLTSILKSLFSGQTLCVYNFFLL